jgi:hypothetical protein
MPSQVVTANTTAQSVAAEKENARVRPTSISIDGLNAAGNRVLQLQDIFTPAVTNGVAVPSETTVTRWKWTVNAGDQLTFNKEDLAGIVCLGAMKVISDVTDANVIVTVGYEHDE